MATCTITNKKTNKIMVTKSSQTENGDYFEVKQELIGLFDRIELLDIKSVYRCQFFLYVELTTETGDEHVLHTDKIALEVLIVCLSEYMKICVPNLIQKILALNKNIPIEEFVVEASHDEVYPYYTEMCETVGELKKQFQKIINYDEVQEILKDLKNYPDDFKVATWMNPGDMRMEDLKVKHPCLLAEASERNEAIFLPSSDPRLIAYVIRENFLGLTGFARVQYPETANNAFSLGILSATNQYNEEMDLRGNIVVGFPGFEDTCLLPESYGKNNFDCYWRFMRGEISSEKYARLVSETQDEEVTEMIISRENVDMDRVKKEIEKGDLFECSSALSARNIQDEYEDAKKSMDKYRLEEAENRLNFVKNGFLLHEFIHCDSYYFHEVDYKTQILVVMTITSCKYEEAIGKVKEATADPIWEEINKKI